MQWHVERLSLDAALPAGRHGRSVVVVAGQTLEFRLRAGDRSPRAGRRRGLPPPRLALSLSSPEDWELAFQVHRTEGPCGNRLVVARPEDLSVVHQARGSRLFSSWSLRYEFPCPGRFTLDFRARPRPELLADRLASAYARASPHRLPPRAPRDHLHISERFEVVTAVEYRRRFRRAVVRLAPPEGAVVPVAEDGRAQTVVALPAETIGAWPASREEARRALAQVPGVLMGARSSAALDPFRAAGAVEAAFALEEALERAIREELRRREMAEIERFVLPAAVVLAPTTALLYLLPEGQRLELGLRIAPVIGDIIDAVELVGGRDVFTGEQLDVLTRTDAGISLGASVVVPMAGRLMRLADGGVTVGRVAHRLGRVPDAFRAALGDLARMGPETPTAVRRVMTTERPTLADLRIARRYLTSLTQLLTSRQATAAGTASRAAAPRSPRPRAARPAARTPRRIPRRGDDVLERADVVRAARGRRAARVGNHDYHVTPGGLVWRCSELCQQVTPVVEAVLGRHWASRPYSASVAQVAGLVHLTVENARRKGMDSQRALQRLREAKLAHARHRRATRLRVHEFLAMLDNLTRHRPLRDIDVVLDELTASGRHHSGIVWVMRFLEQSGTWPMVDGFEIALEGRVIDLGFADHLFEFKDWSAWAPMWADSLALQVVKDLVSSRYKQHFYIFSGRLRMTQGEMQARFHDAVRARLDDLTERPGTFPARGRQALVGQTALIEERWRGLWASRDIRILLVADPGEYNNPLGQVAGVTP